MVKKLLLALTLSFFASNAFAVCAKIPLNVLDSVGGTAALSSATAADGNCKTYIDADTSSQLHNDITAATPAGTNRIGYTTDDPCNNASANTYKPIDIVTAASTVVSTGV